MNAQLRRRWRVAVVIGALASSSVSFPASAGPAAGAASAAPILPAHTPEELRAQLAAHLTQARFSPALWGVKVISLDTGRTLFEHHADRLLSPASNAKLYTGAMALDRLGPDYRIVTPILATAKPDRDGVV